MDFVLVHFCSGTVVGTKHDITYSATYRMAKYVCVLSFSLICSFPLFFFLFLAFMSVWIVGHSSCRSTPSFPRPLCFVFAFQELVLFSG